MRTGLLSELSALGYEILLNGENIHLHYQKEGKPPEAVLPLLDELKKHKAEVVNMLRMGKVVSPDEVTPSQSVSWSLEFQALIDWFMELDTPTEPFYLEDHRHIINPSKFFAALRKDIEAGPDGPRGIYGALIHDLIAMKKVLH
jgi:hypothetical protein